MWESFLIRRWPSCNSRSDDEPETPRKQLSVGSSHQCHQTPVYPGVRKLCRVPPAWLRILAVLKQKIWRLQISLVCFDPSHLHTRGWACHAQAGSMRKTACDIVSLIPNMCAITDVRVYCVKAALNLTGSRGAVLACHLAIMLPTLNLSSRTSKQLVEWIPFVKPRLILLCFHLGERFPLVLKCW